jgi:hypothetical protein
MTILYHYDADCRLTYQSSATYDALDGSINIPAHATTLAPLGAVYPDLDVFDITHNCWTIEKHVEPEPEPEPIPETIEELRAKMVLPALQFELNLIDSGYQDKVLAILAAMPADSPFLAYWRRVATFERLHPMVVGMASQLGLSDEETDAVFTMKTA